ncbi:unnamed protein product [Rhizoctonia solani]|uniref:Uncharacterized protein n=1 Tax=Rhizoctonia solani TaxID=456999 RepID=A0A8H3C4S1_9AGAM|nr:unnamed protein product [Rhizoctonia solani]
MASGDAHHLVEGSDFAEPNSPLSSERLLESPVDRFLRCDDGLPPSPTNLVAPYWQVLYPRLGLLDPTELHRPPHSLQNNDGEVGWPPSRLNRTAPQPPENVEDSLTFGPSPTRSLRNQVITPATSHPTY